MAVWPFPLRLGRRQCCHIERHEFTPEEVEEVFAGGFKVRRTRQKLYVALGERSMATGVCGFFAAAWSVIRVITARDMEDKERRLFRRK